jgi:hypothetical protein
MAQNTTTTIAAATWTQLTDADIARITFQNVGSNHVLIKATIGASTPTNATGAIRYNPGQGERNVLLTDLFPGLVGANRVYAYSPDATQIVVSHA